MIPSTQLAYVYGVGIFRRVRLQKYVFGCAKNILLKPTRLKTPPVNLTMALNKIFSARSKKKLLVACRPKKFYPRKAKKKTLVACSSKHHVKFENQGALPPGPPPGLCPGPRQGALPPGPPELTRRLYLAG